MKRIIYILLLKIIVTGSLYSQEIINTFKIYGYNESIYYVSDKKVVKVDEDDNYYIFFDYIPDSINVNGQVYHSQEKYHKEGFIVVDKNFEFKEVIECQNCLMLDMESKGDYYYILLSSYLAKDINFLHDTIEHNTSGYNNSSFLVVMNKKTGKIEYKLKIKDCSGGEGGTGLIGEDIVFCIEMGTDDVEIQGKTIEGYGLGSTVLVVRLDWRQDSVKWLTKLGGIEGVTPTALEVDDEGNVIVSGISYDEVVKINDKKYKLGGYGKGYGSPYLLKLGSEDGAFKYIRAGISNGSPERFLNINTSVDGDLYVNCFANDDIILPDTTYELEILDYSYRGAIIKFDRNGEIDWGFVMVSPEGNFVDCVFDKKNGDLLAGGSFVNTVELNSVKYKSDYEAEGFILRMSQEGNISFVKLMDTRGNAHLTSSAINSKGNFITLVEGRGWDTSIHLFGRDYPVVPTTGMLVEIDRSFLVGTQETEGVKEYGFELLSNVLQSGTPIGIEFAPSMNEEEFSIQLVNSSGQIQKVIKKEKGMQKLYVETTGLSTGIHFVMLRTKQGTFFRKVVIQ